jgi:hypothetical protein
MKKLNVFLFAVCGLFVGYYFWSFFVSSRYQALCGITFWFATREQVEACKDVKTELDQR